MKQVKTMVVSGMHALPHNYHITYINNHMKPRYIITGLFIGIIIIACIVIKIMTLLGPISKPDLHKYRWNSITISYWMSHVNEPKRRINTNKHSIVINDQESLDRLSKYFIIKNIRPKSIANSDEIIIDMGKGGKWQGRFISEDYFTLCHQNNMYYSYSIELFDRSFFDELFGYIIEKEHDRLGDHRIYGLISRDQSPSHRYQGIEDAPPMSTKPIPLAPEQNPALSTDAQGNLPPAGERAAPPSQGTD